MACKTTTRNTVSKSPKNLASVKLLEIKKYNSVNQFKSVSENFDTIFLLSQKKKEYIIDSSNFVYLRLEQITRFRVGTMEQLGAYLITGNDTLWSGQNIAKAPKFYWIVDN